MVWIWVGGGVGKIWEGLREGESMIRIHEKFSFNKEEELMLQDLERWLRGKEHLSVTQV